MADETRIIDWALNQASLLKLRATPLTRVSGWLPGYHDYLVQISPFGTVYEGRGTDKVESIALTKGIVEAVERLLKDQMELPTTNGLAGHSSSEEAGLAARLELVERDAFLCHYLTETQFYPISLAGFENLPEYLRNAALCCASHGVRLEIRELRRIHDAYTVLTVALGPTAKPPFGIVLGIASGTALLDTLERSVLECVRNVIAALDGNRPAPLSCEEFQGLESYGPIEHDRLALFPGSAEVILPYLALPASHHLSRWADHTLELADIAAEAVELGRHVPELASFPGHFALAHSDTLQPLFFGPSTGNRINFNRISQFIGRAAAASDLQPHPHILG